MLGPQVSASANVLTGNLIGGRGESLEKQRDHFYTMYNECIKVYKIINIKIAKGRPHSSVSYLKAYVFACQLNCPLME